MNSLEKMTLFLSKNNQERYLFYTQEYPYHPRHNSHFVGNKAKGRISKRMLQENKARQIFRKTNISYPLICITWRYPNVTFSFEQEKDCMLLLQNEDVSRQKKKIRYTGLSGGESCRYLFIFILFF